MSFCPPNAVVEGVWRGRSTQCSMYTASIMVMEKPLFAKKKLAISYLQYYIGAFFYVSQGSKLLPNLVRSNLTQPIIKTIT